jgi:hypothetical protein
LLCLEPLPRVAAQKVLGAGRVQRSESQVVLGLESSESPAECLASQQRALPQPELLLVLQQQEDEWQRLQQARPGALERRLGAEHWAGLRVELLPALPSPEAQPEVLLASPLPLPPWLAFPLRPQLLLPRDPGNACAPTRHGCCRASSNASSCR